MQREGRVQCVKRGAWVEHLPCARGVSQAAPSVACACGARVGNGRRRARTASIGSVALTPGISRAGVRIHARTLGGSTEVSEARRPT